MRKKGLARETYSVYYIKKKEGYLYPRGEKKKKKRLPAPRGANPQARPQCYYQQEKRGRLQSHGGKEKKGKKDILLLRNKRPRPLVPPEEEESDPIQAVGERERKEGLGVWVSKKKKSCPSQQEGRLVHKRTGGGETAVPPSGPW